MSTNFTGSMMPRTHPSASNVGLDELEKQAPSKPLAKQSPAFLREPQAVDGATESWKVLRKDLHQVLFKPFSHPKDSPRDCWN